MENVRLLIGYFRPSLLQVVYSLVLSLLVALYWCRSQLTDILTPAGAPETIATFQGMLKQTVDHFTKNDAIAFLSVACIWALVGVLLLAILYETINIFITIRNDIVISSKFTHAEENKKHILQEIALRVSLAIGFMVCLVTAIVFLFPLWEQYITSFASAGFWGNYTVISKGAIGIIGLWLTICLLWRWLLLSLPKFT